MEMEKGKADTRTKKSCASCRHFRRYYMKEGGCYQGLEFGHCGHSSRRRRKADTPACSAYRALIEDEIAVLETPSGEMEKPNRDDLAEMIQKALMKA